MTHRVIRALFLGAFMGASFSSLTLNIEAFEQRENTTKIDTLRSLSFVRVTTKSEDGDNKKLAYTKSCMGPCVQALTKADWDTIKTDTNGQNIKAIHITGDPQTCDQLKQKLEKIDGINVQANFQADGQMILKAKMDDKKANSKPWDLLWSSIWESYIKDGTLNGGDGATQVSVILANTH